MLSNRGLERLISNRGLERLLSNRWLERLLSNRGLERLISNRGLERLLSNHVLMLEIPFRSKGVSKEEERAQINNSSQKFLVPKNTKLYLPVEYV